MSALSALFNEDEFLFATDTLVTSGGSFPSVYQNSLSKVDFYPHLNCCVVTLGFSRLGTDYYRFLNHLIGASDVAEIPAITERGFLEFLNIDDYPLGVMVDKDGNDEKNIGSLYVMGFSRTLKKLVAYKIDVDRDGIKYRAMGTDNQKFIHPPIGEEAENEVIEAVKAANGTLHDCMIGFVKRMHLDSLNEETFTVGVGCEIHLTSITATPDGQCIFAFSAAHRFPTFEEDLQSMRDRNYLSKVSRIIENTRNKLKELDHRVADTINA